MAKVIERTKGTIRFAFKESLKSLAKQPTKQSLIYLLFSFGYKRFKYSTGYSSCLNDWDVNKQRVRNRAHILNSAEINDHLNRLESELKKELTRLDSLGEEISMDKLKDKLNAITNKDFEEEETRNKNFYQYYQSFLDRKKGTVKPITLRSYRQTKTLLERFNPNLNFQDIDYDFANDFREFLEEENKVLNTIGKHFKNLRVVLNSATKDGENDYHLFKNREFSVPKEQTTAIYLDENEIDKISKLDLSTSPRMGLARDIFLIGCHTGQRISDYNGLTNDNIIELNRGGKKVKFFKVRQKKTGKQVLCPITKEIQLILSKPQYKKQPPPKMNEQEINRYLKKIGRKAGINEKINNEFTRGGKKITEKIPKYQMIGTHTARRSFCTNMYKKKMPIYDIMNFSGHSTEREFYKYIRIEKEERSLDILEGGFFNI